MSKAMDNPKTIATQDAPENAGVTPTQIADNADFPHSGLIKVLNLRGQGNYATSGFNATNVGATGITFAEGTIFRQGKKITVNQGSTQTLTVPSSVTNSYHLVVNQQGTTNLQLRSGGAADIVPAFTADDVIVAVLKHTGSDPMQIQYLTFNQTENSVSIARKSGGAYTEGLTIQSNSGDIEIEAKESDKDIIFKVNDATAGSVVDRLTLYGDNDPNFPNTEVKIEGGLLVTEDLTMNKIALGYANSPASGVAEISAYANSEPMVFKTGSSVERLRIEAGGNVGIGTTSPSTKVEIQGAATDSLFKITDDSNQLQFEVKGDGTLTTDITASRALVTDANKNITASAVTSAELGLLSGAAFGIGNNNILRANSNVVDNDFLRVDGTQVEGRSASEVLSDIGGQASLTFGISNTNAVKIDSASVADDDFARFTANGLEGRSASELASDIGALTGTFGIANNNILQANANLADDDFLRVDGTQIEGRTAAQTLSDIGAMPLAGGTFTGAVTVDTGQTFRSPRLPIVSVSAATTLTEATHAGAYLKCAGNVTLPVTSADGVHYTILNTTGGNITVGRNTNNINGAASDITVATFNAVTCICIGTNDWIALGV